MRSPKLKRCFLALDENDRNIVKDVVVSIEE